MAVYVDGCFWHRYPKHGTKPKSNQWYWTEKLSRNVARDSDVDSKLAKQGWRVIRVWEHEDSETTASLIAQIVRNQLDLLAAP